MCYPLEPPRCAADGGREISRSYTEGLEACQWGRRIFHRLLGETLGLRAGSGGGWSRVAAADNEEDLEWILMMDVGGRV